MCLLVQIHSLLLTLLQFFRCHLQSNLIDVVNWQLLFLFISRHSRFGNETCIANNVSEYKIKKTYAGLQPRTEIIVERQTRQATHSL